MDSIKRAPVFAISDLKNLVSSSEVAVLDGGL